MDLQPHSLGDSLVALSPLREEDFDSLFQAASDPLIWEQHPDRFRHEKEVFSGYFRGAIDSKGAFLVVDKANGEAIGSSRFYNHDAEARTICVGWTFLRRRCWGGEYNYRLKKLMLDHAFRSVDCVLFQIGQENLRSIKATEKLGAARVREEILEGIKHFLYRLDMGAWETRTRFSPRTPRPW